jgi:hypothetical protein
MVRKSVKTGAKLFLELQIQSSRRRRALVDAAWCYEDPAQHQSSLSTSARHASAFLRADLKKVYQCVSGFFRLFFQDPMTSVWQYNYGDAIRDEFHLRAELVA